MQKKRPERKLDEQQQLRAKQHAERRLEEQRRAKQAEKKSFAPAAPPSVTETKAVLGPKLHFRGEISGEEDIVIQGVFEGSIDLQHNKLIIGEQGELKGDVTAKNIFINGKVEGELYGKESIIISSTSQVLGNIKAERVSLEDGARFKGSIEMDFDAPHEDSELDSFSVSGSNYAPSPLPATEPEKSESALIQDKIERIEANRQLEGDDSDSSDDQKTDS